MSPFLWVCLGGACGTGARYLFSGWALRLLGTAFPYGTLTINALGSLLISLVMYVGLHTTLISPTVRVALTSGVMGGFTTYSTFNHEMLSYFQEGRWLMALLYLLCTVVLCLCAGMLGLLCGRWLFPR